MEGRELAVMGPQRMIDVAESALSIDQLVKQRDLITTAMAKAMKEGDHYGKIPGCGDKPTLLQPGAQLLAHLFRLRPEYEVIESDLPHGHKRFRVICKLFFIGAIPEIKIGEGVGESSSMESKHRYRNAAAEVEPTGQPLPKAFWTWRETMGEVEARKKLGEAFDGQNVGPKKIDGSWQVVIYKGGTDQKVENPNPADVFNTVLKIAKKRAFVDATITATASSDFFTQDLEDIRDNLAAVETGTETNGKADKAAPKQEQEKAAKVRKTKSSVPAESEDDEIPMYNGPKHEALAKHLDNEMISESDFLEAAKHAKLIPAKANSFRLMKDETAAQFLDDAEIIPTIMKAWRQR